MKNEHTETTSEHVLTQAELEKLIFEKIERAKQMLLARDNLELKTEDK
jgi:hypothetical protein